MHIIKIFQKGGITILVLIALIICSSIIINKYEFKTNLQRTRIGGLEVYTSHRKLAEAEETPKERHIAFVHIGKCAGTTAAEMIRKGCYRRKDPSKCLEKEIQDETAISKSVEEYFHMRDVNIEKYNSFIVTVRDPIDRIVSWFVYQHPSNEMYENQGKALTLWKCYNNLNDFAVLGLRDLPDNLDSMSVQERQCMHLARDAIFAKMPDYLFPHLSYNYEFHIGSLSQHPEKEVMVLRKEEFWDDWQKINTMLGGGTITKTKEYTHHFNSENLKYNNRTLSATAVQNLCKVLCSEIQLYKKLIQRATNLEAGQKLRSIYKLSATCPTEARTKVCQSSTRNVAFVSIGKTGGSTAALLLKKGCFTAGCRTRIIEDESEISRQVTHLYHLRTVPAHLHNSFIVSTRDPIDRITAWYIYQHPRNRIYPTHPEAMKLYLCYKTIQEFAEAGLRVVKEDENLSSNDRECINLAKLAISGNAPPYHFPHLAYNYQYYLKEILTKYPPEEKEIFVMRFEYFWNDFQSINTELGGKVLTKPNRLHNINVVLPPETLIAKKQLAVTDTAISETGMANLCRVMCEEIHIYKELMKRAKNIVAQDKEFMFKKLYLKCPTEVSTDNCDNAMP